MVAKLKRKINDSQTVANIRPEKEKRMKKWQKAALIILIVCLCLWVLIGAVVLIAKALTYDTDWDAIRELENEGGYHLQDIGDDTLVFVPDDPKVGFIFYPGGFVEYSAYIPLMRALAAEGILCILPRMPLNLAVLDVNAAEGMKEHFPQIKSWYIGGHSLGGSMAASYLEKNQDQFVGLILLASYSTADLSESYSPALSIYGSCDGVLNMKKYDENKKNLPFDNFTEYVIDGGNHAGFASYGVQKGDGEATISFKEQIDITVEQIRSFIG